MDTELKRVVDVNLKDNMGHLHSRKRDRRHRYSSQVYRSTKKETAKNSTEYQHGEDFKSFVTRLKAEPQTATSHVPTMSPIA